MSFDNPRRSGKTIVAELWYPRVGGEGCVDTVEVGLSDVRAADSLFISFDFERNGYSIKMQPVVEGVGAMLEAGPLEEVAFATAYLEKTGRVWCRNCETVAPESAQACAECGAALPEVELHLLSPEQAEPLLGLAWGVAHNAGRRSHVRKARWSHVMDVTGMGSTSAQKLCRDQGVDPDEEIGGET